MKFILSIFLLLTLVDAQEKYSTIKTSCIQQSNYSGKTLDQLKDILLNNAKKEALGELYGQLIYSKTDLKDGKIISDEIRSRAIGSVRVQGNPKFYNGKDFGSICSDVTSYITEKDLEKYSPKKVKLSHYCFNDSSVAMKDIKSQAKFGAYKEIISRYKPSLRLSNNQAESFIHGFEISNDNFDFDTASYCFDAVGTILPYELEIENNSKNSKDNLKSCNAIKTKLPNSKNGIYTIKPKDKNYKVYCDMETDNSGWTRVFYHNITFGTFKNNEEAYETNIDNPTAHSKYSILSKLESFKKDGKFTFKIQWANLSKKNIWSQTSNPTYQNILGYEAINIETENQNWGGLELSYRDETFIDGSVYHKDWYYSIGSKIRWHNGIPAYFFNKATNSVELYIK